MVNNNVQKKKIDDIFVTYSSKIKIVKAKRDKIIFDFLEVLKEKKVEELRNSIKQL